MTEMQRVKRQTPSPLASGSVSEHLVRGVVGLIAAVLAVALLGSVGPVSLALLAVTALAWRGCPTCWTVGLLAKLGDARARCGDCDGEYRCRRAQRDGGARGQL
jgi:hypothetical protein